MLLISMLAISSLGAAELELDRRWVITAPDGWWYSQIENSGALRVYTFGPDSPEPVKETPVFLVDNAMKGHTPLVIRGISVGIAIKPTSTVIIEGSEKLTRTKTGEILGDGYRKEVETTSGKLVLYVFVFAAKKLPGEPLPNPESRMVILHVAGKNDEEAEAFTKIFESIKPAAGTKKD